MEKNRRLLGRKFPYLFKEIDQNGAAEEIEVEVTRSKTGLPVARVNRMNRRLYLNSVYDPEAEAGRWIDSRVRPETECLVICGGGFLYHLKALLQRGIYKKIIVYEPSPVILRSCLQAIDLDQFPKGDYLLLTGINTELNTGLIMQYLGTDLGFRANTLQIEVLPSYAGIFHQEIAGLQEKLKHILRVIQMNLTTNATYNEQWLANSFMNLRPAVSAPVVRHFLNQFTGVPAIIVSAGPSLERNIHLLREVKEKAVIICAGSSIRAMLHHGVIPHFLMVIDGHQINAMIYNDLDLKDVCLVHSLRTYPPVVENFRGKRVFMRTDVEGFPDILSPLYQGREIGTIASAFSVSCSCLDLAVKMGCNPVVLIGQDLSYTGNKRYAEGQLGSHQFFVSENHMPKFSMIGKDIYGQDVLTDKPFMEIKFVFERLINHTHPGKAEFINATEAGLPILGTSNLKLAEVIGKYCRRELGISGRINASYEEGLRELQHLNINIDQFALQLKRLVGEGQDRMAELIDKLQRLRKFNFIHDFNLPVMEPVLEAIVNEYDQTLRLKEYQVLLRELADTRLKIQKYTNTESDKITNRIEYDGRLRNYLNIIIETDKLFRYAQKCIEESFQQSDPKPATIEPLAVAETGEPDRQAAPRDISTLAAKIKRRENLKEVEQILIEQLNKTPESRERYYYSYLYGLFLSRQNQAEKAIAVLEEATALGSALPEVHFELFKLYYNKKLNVKAGRHLERCRGLNFRTGYCLKMLIKMNYTGYDYVAVNNLITDNFPLLAPKKFFRILKIECLSRLGLYNEAGREYQSLIEKYPLSRRETETLQRFCSPKDADEYERRYRQNTLFFKTRGLDLPDYADVKYKVVRFLSGELVYQSESGHFLPYQSEPENVNFEITPDSVLLIHDPETVNIFQRFQKILNENGAERRLKQIGAIPVYIVDRDFDHWLLLLQWFDFNLLDKWYNLHFCIAPTDEELQSVFLDEAAPLPNLLYGREPESYHKLLLEVKEIKDRLHQKRLSELQEYYQAFSAKELPEKVLIIAANTDDAYQYYGEMLQTYLNENGITCLVHKERAPYYRFTPYDDAVLVNDFRPDLVVHLSALREESEVFKMIPVPFISWFLVDKSFDPELPANLNQSLILTGNLQIGEYFKSAAPDRVSQVLLPVVIKKNSPPVTVENEIGIFSGLEDFQGLIKNLGTVIFNLVNRKQPVREADIANILQRIYISLYTGEMSENFQKPGNGYYEKVLADNLARYGLNIDSPVLALIAGMIKKEFENPVLKLLQTKWVVNDLKGYRLALYGAGWEKDPDLQPFHQGTFDFYTNQEFFEKLVLSSKVNLYIGTMLPNHSYLQPDLVNGIAYGGFFLVNDLFVKEHGESVLEPFGNLLVTYSSKAEMLEKIKYFLEHEEERRERAEILKEYVIRNFAMDKFGKPLLFQAKKNQGIIIH